MKIVHFGSPLDFELSDSLLIRRESVLDTMREVGEAILPAGDWWRYDEIKVHAVEHPSVRSDDGGKLMALHLQLWDHGARATRDWTAWARTAQNAEKLRKRFEIYTQTVTSLNQYLMSEGRLWPFLIDATVLPNSHEVGRERSDDARQQDCKFIGGQIEDAGGSHGYTFFYPHHQTPGALVLISSGPIEPYELIQWQAAGAHAFAKLTHRVDTEVTSQLLDTLGIRLGLDHPSPSRLHPLLRFLAVHRERINTKDAELATTHDWQEVLLIAIQDAVTVTLGRRFGTIHLSTLGAQARLERALAVADKLRSALSAIVSGAMDFPVLRRADRGVIQAVLTEALRNAIRYHDHGNPTAKIEIAITNKSITVSNSIHPQLAVWPEEIGEVVSAQECLGADGDHDPLATLEHGGVGVTVFVLAVRKALKDSWKIRMGPDDKGIYRFVLEEVVLP